MLTDALSRYAWGDYTWGKKSDYSDYNGKKIPSRIPLSTMIAGIVELPAVARHEADET